MFTIGRVDGVNDYNITVVGTGDQGKDDSNLDQAVSRLNNWGRGTLWIDGTVYLSTSKQFTAPIHVRGLDAASKIIVTNTSDSFVAFGWNDSFSPFGLSTYNISTSARFQEYISTSGTGYSPVEGDWVLIWSNDSITEMDPHVSGGFQKPMEIHQVQEYDSTLQRAYLADEIIDLLSSSGRLAVLSMDENVVVENLIVDHAGSQGIYQDFMSVKNVNGLTVRNIKFTRNGPGAIRMNVCANIDISNIIVEGTNAVDDVYTVMPGVVNKLMFRDSVVYGTRHGFTTTAGVSSGNTRWGTPLNCVVDNVSMYVVSQVGPTDVKESRSGLDTHPEGWGVTIQNCKIHVMGDRANIGITTRSRNTIIKDCSLYGNRFSNALAKGVVVYAPNAIIKDCLFDGFWRGVYTDYNYGSTKNNFLSIDGCTFREMTGEAVVYLTGSGHTVNNCEFRRIAWISPYAAINFQNVSTGNHTVSSNTFFKDQSRITVYQYNHIPSDIKFIGNTCIGYSNPESSGPLGFQESGVYGQNFERAYAYVNHTDNAPYAGRKSGQDALGSISGAQLIDFSAGLYDNKTAVLTSNVTLTASGDFAGEYHLLISQDASGVRAITWGNVSWNGTDPQPKTGANAVSLFQLYHTGDGNWYGLGYFNN